MKCAYWISAIAILGLSVLAEGGAKAQSLFGIFSQDEPAKRENAATRGSDKTLLENFQETTEASRDPNKCDPLENLMDADGDIRRNLDKLSTAELCPKLEVFHEGSLKWVLQIIQNKSKPNGILWFVPHDNEHDAFDTAVYGLRKYGGTLIAVETEGHRFNGPQDPNRNFDAGTGLKCREQIAPSPKYTNAIMRWRKPGTLIIALHSNERGYAGDGQGGAGGISMAKPLPHSLPFRARNPISVASPDDTMIFVASTSRPDRDEPLAQFVAKLNENGVNVLYEVVSRHSNDCSMSNYAALKGIRNYFNIEVVTGDGAGQRKVLDVLMGALPQGGLSPASQAKPNGASADRKQEETAVAGSNSSDSVPSAASSTIALWKADPPSAQEDSENKTFLVQIASASNEAAAEREWQRRISQFVGLLGEQKPIFDTSSRIRDKEVIRVLIGPFDNRQEAVEFCQKMQDAAKQQDIREKVCLVR